MQTIKACGWSTNESQSMFRLSKRLFNARLGCRDSFRGVDDGETDTFKISGSDEQLGHLCSLHHPAIKKTCHCY